MYALSMAPQHVLGDAEIMLAAICKPGPTPYGDLLESSPMSLRTDRDVLMKCVEYDAGVLDHTSPRLRADRALILHAARHDGYNALRFCAQSLKADREIMVAALENNPDALGFVAGQLRHDPAIKAAVKAGSEQRRKAEQQLRRGQEESYAGLMESILSEGVPRYDVRCVDCDRLPWQKYGAFPVHRQHRRCEFQLWTNCRGRFSLGDDVKTRPCLHIMCADCAGCPDRAMLMAWCHMCRQDGRFPDWAAASRAAELDASVLEVSGVDCSDQDMIEGIYKFDGEHEATWAPIYKKCGLCRPQSTQQVWLELDESSCWVFVAHGRDGDKVFMQSSSVVQGTLPHAADGWSSVGPRGRLCRQEGVRILAQEGSSSDL
eukprot:TRINITY_DN51124_c0_g1_i1.p1 TRINITY_DN51124_c0_g1~~TRINITY_DN51124_c0_g1_i1.p1  ORF type:complete len:440 (+),score=17.68 TRINITY_DN51124_c0_g1_i1:197-1321(+)